MSIALMSAAFKTALSSTHKFVLVALCDNANDQGECFPSVSMLAEKTSLSDRAVQKSITYLCDMGFIMRNARNGRSTYYTVTAPHTWAIQPPNVVHPRTTFTPNNIHPTPEQCSPPPPNVVHPTPERRSPITIKEPSIEPSMEPPKGTKPSALPDWLPVEEWNGYLEMRRKQRKVPTARAIELVLKALLAMKNTGQDIAAVLDKSTAMGWTDVYPIRENRRATDGRALPAPSRHSGFDQIDYSEGIEDGRIV